MSDANTALTTTATAPKPVQRDATDASANLPTEGESAGEATETGTPIVPDEHCSGCDSSDDNHGSSDEESGDEKDFEAELETGQDNAEDDDGIDAANIIVGKRTRKPVHRYVDPAMAGMYMADIDPSERFAALEDEDLDDDLASDDGAEDENDDEDEDDAAFIASESESESELPATPRTPKKRKLKGTEAGSPSSKKAAH